MVREESDGEVDALPRRARCAFAGRSTGARGRCRSGAGCAAPEGAAGVADEDLGEAWALARPGLPAAERSTGTSRQPRTRSPSSSATSQRGPRTFRPSRGPPGAKRPSQCRRARAGGGRSLPPRRKSHGGPARGPRPVAGARVGPEGTPVGEVLERRQTEGDDAVAGRDALGRPRRRPRRSRARRRGRSSQPVVLLLIGVLFALFSRPQPGVLADLFPAQPSGSFTSG